MKDGVDQITGAGGIELLGGHETPVEDGSEEGYRREFWIGTRGELSVGDAFGDEADQALPARR